MLKLNVGLARKIGEANYSSRGASVNLELEVESGLIEEPRRLQERIHGLFHMAQTAIDEKLEAGGGSAINGHHQQNGHRQSSNRPATDSQCRALRAIAHRQRVNLQDLLHEQYDVARPEDLGISQASAMIDHLRGTANGSGAHR